MKLIFSLVLILTSLNLLSQNFDGEIKFIRTNNIKKDTIAMLYQLKENKVRITTWDKYFLDENTYSLLLDTIFYSIDKHSRKIGKYINMDEKKIAAKDFKKTKVIKTILGYQCTEYIQKDKTCKTYYYFCNDLKTSSNLGILNSSLGIALERIDETPKIKITTRATSIEKKEMQGELFVLPEGYTTKVIDSKAIIKSLLKK